MTKAPETYTPTPTPTPPPAPLPIGTRVEVVTCKYGQYTGLQGTVVAEPPEMASFNPPIDYTGITWVRFDGDDDRVPAPGFDLSDGVTELRVLPAAVPA